MPVALDHEEALDPVQSGAKAARLAAARRAGLAALDGVVVEAEHSIAVLRRALEVACERGAGAARLFVMDAELPGGLVGAVLELAPWQRLVVRSSSPLERDPGWSGAFASYVGVGREDLDTALRGCWASTLGRDALERFEHLGTDPAALGMAVLVQPAIDPAPGGVAEMLGDVARITVAEGELAGMLQGWGRGLTAEVDGSGEAHGPAVERYGPDLLLVVADLVRSCRDLIGDDHIEWGLEAGTCHLLQSRRDERPRPPARSARRERSAALLGADAVRLARAAAHFGGPLGGELVLPWSCAAGGAGSRHFGPASAPPVVSGAHALRAACRALAAQAWGCGEEEAMERARGALVAARDQLDAGAVAQLCSLCPIDDAEAARIVATVEHWAVATSRGAVATSPFAPSDAWRLPVDFLEALSLGTLPRGPELAPSGSGWEPFICQTALANGQLHSGEPAADGLGAGRLLVLDEPRRLASGRERHVLAVREPLPAYAPLLWGAAALVAASGSASAHLFDVARSLAVPAVAGVKLEGGGDATIVAVDGSTGEVFVC